MDSGFLSWIFVGLVIGVAVRLALLRGDPGDPGGFVVAILLGIAGALFGGILGRAQELFPPGDPMEWIAAAAGAIILLALYRLVMRRRAA